jgi:hypothetical protein
VHPRLPLGAAAELHGDAWHELQDDAAREPSFLARNEGMEKAHSKAVKNVQVAQAQQRKQHDKKKAQSVALGVGMQVYLKPAGRRKDVSGPFKVSAVQEKTDQVVLERDDQSLMIVARHMLLAKPPK